MSTEPVATLKAGRRAMVPAAVAALVLALVGATPALASAQRVGFWTLWGLQATNSHLTRLFACGGPGRCSARQFAGLAKDATIAGDKITGSLDGSEEDCFARYADRVANVFYGIADAASVRPGSGRGDMRSILPYRSKIKAAAVAEARCVALSGP